jgi:hypothetical protein
MIRRSECGHRRSIRWLVWMKTDAPREALQHRMNRHLGQGEASVYPTVIFETYSTAPSEKSSAPDEPTPWSRGSIGLSDGYIWNIQYCPEWEVFTTGWTDAPSVHSVGAVLSENLNGYVTWRAPDEPMPRKSIASVHPTLSFSAAFSQRLVWCLGLFIPPPLPHLRLLDCVEVQRSSRHLEDQIQSIQVLNCSSIDLHMLSVCA